MQKYKKKRYTYLLSFATNNYTGSRSSSNNESNNNIRNRQRSSHMTATASKRWDAYFWIRRSIATNCKQTPHNQVQWLPFFEFSITSTPNWTVSFENTSKGSLSSEPLLSLWLLTKVPLLLFVSCKKNYNSKEIKITYYDTKQNMH